MPQPTPGTSNNFPEGQCTYYADQRYHDLTGMYVPFSGNAQDWYGNAQAYGWTVSTKPVVPSIMCLQAGIQGASSTFGHVGVVESINGSNFVASNLNWGNNPSQVAQVTFHVAPGVSFIYATDSSGKPLGSAGGNSILDAFNQIVKGGSGSSVTLAPNADVTGLLDTLDTVMLVTNPFAVKGVTTDTIAGATFTDPISWVEGFGLNLFDDAVALLLRALFVIVGLVIILKVISNFIDFGAIASSVTSGAKTAAMFA